MHLGLIILLFFNNVSEHDLALEEDDDDVGDDVEGSDEDDKPTLDSDLGGAELASPESSPGKPLSDMEKCATYYSFPNRK